MEYNLLFDAYYLWSFTDKNERLMEIVLLILRKLEPKAHALTMHIQLFPMLNRFSFVSI